MDQERESKQGPNVIEGADDGALGTGDPPHSAAPGASVDGTEERVPGPPMDGPGRAEKPWSSSLAAESAQAGVGNDPAEERDGGLPQDEPRD